MAAPNEPEIAKGFEPAGEPWTGPALKILALFLGAFVLHSVYLACIAEDAHITFRFARNLAEGYGFTWNTDELPIEGFTSFLWVLVTALGIKANLDIFLRD